MGQLGDAVFLKVAHEVRWSKIGWTRVAPLVVQQRAFVDYKIVALRLPNQSRQQVGAVLSRVYQGRGPENCDANGPKSKVCKGDFHGICQITVDLWVGLLMKDGRRSARVRPVYSLALHPRD